MQRTTQIGRIEAGMIERLAVGLGKLVRSVSAYGGELDEDLGTVVRVFPAVWVAFLGVRETKFMNTAHTKTLARGRFTVMVGQRSLRSESAPRNGSRDQVGTYQLIYAIRRLLMGQDFGLDGVGQMAAGAVRPLFNGRTKGDACSIFALEFDVKWVEHVLLNGQWPRPDPDQIGDPTATDPDLIFPEAGGQTDEPYPWLAGIQLDYRLTNRKDSDPPDATDTVTLNKES